MVEPARGYTKRSSSAERGAREAHVLNGLQGPGIVPLQGASDLGEPVLAGAACSLADVLHERGPLSDGEVRAVAAAAATTLARVHGAGLVHGDVKPANLLLSGGGELWLADFDTAAAADGKPLVRYSPGRLPPGSPARPEADIAALAVSLVELSTGALVDPAVRWRAGDLRRMGCPPSLSTEIAFLMGDPDLRPTAQAAASMFHRSGPTPLPAPATATRQVDPTPTVDFMPARPAPPSVAISSTETDGHTRPWWRRLAASWRRR